MIPEFIGAGLDLFYLLWFWLPGIVMAYRFGFRYFTDLLPIGFLLSSAVSTLVYSVTFALGLSSVSVPTTRVILLIGGLVAVATLLKSLKTLAMAGLWAATISAVAIVFRNILRLDGWMQQADHWLSGWIAELAQSGNDALMHSFVDVHKKGIAFPIVYGMGREGLFLAAIPTVILILIVMATYRLTATILTADSAKTRIWIFLGILALWLSTSMFLGFSTYQHGHGFVTLGVAIAGRLVITTLPRHNAHSTLQSAISDPSTWMVAIGLFVATFVMAQSRIESFALGMLLVLPFLWQRSPKKTWRAFLPRLLAVLGGPMGFLIWFGSIQAMPVDFAPPAVIFGVIFLVAIIGASSLFLVPGLNDVARWGIPLAFAGALISYLFPFFGSRNHFFFLRLNTFYGEGLWGYTWWFFLAAGIFLALDKTKTPRENLALWLGVVVVMFTILVKAIDNFGQAGQGVIRDGWSDSVNRTLFHAFSLVTAIGAVAVSRVLRRSSAPTASAGEPTTPNPDGYPNPTRRSLRTNR